MSKKKTKCSGVAGISIVVYTNTLTLYINIPVSVFSKVQSHTSSVMIVFIKNVWQFQEITIKEIMGIWESLFTF